LSGPCIAWASMACSIPVNELSGYGQLVILVSYSLCMGTQFVVPPSHFKPFCASSNFKILLHSSIVIFSVSQY